MLATLSPQERGEGRKKRAGAHSHRRASSCLRLYVRAVWPILKRAGKLTAVDPRAVVADAGTALAGIRKRGNWW